jgi:hypothetical protein
MAQFVLVNTDFIPGRIMMVIVFFNKLNISYFVINKFEFKTEVNVRY